jgi:hypothetical protein
MDQRVHAPAGPLYAESELSRSTYSDPEIYHFEGAGKKPELQDAGVGDAPACTLPAPELKGVKPFPRVLGDGVGDVSLPGLTCAVFLLVHNAVVRRFLA